MPRHRFPKGHKFGKGRPRKSAVQQLNEALSHIENQKHRTFIQHFVEMAWDNADLAKTLAGKLLPDLKDIKTQGGRDYHQIILIRDPKASKEEIAKQVEKRTQVNLESTKPLEAKK